MLGLQQQLTVAGALHRLTSSRARSRAKAVLRLILALGHKFHFALYSAVEFQPLRNDRREIVRFERIGILLEIIPAQPFADFAHAEKFRARPAVAPILRSIADQVNRGW